MRRAVAAVLILFTLAGCGSGAATSGTDATSVPSLGQASPSPTPAGKGGGGRQTSADVRSSFLHVLEPPAVSTSGTKAASALAASASIPLTSLAPVADQWQFESCGAFAIGYELDTFIVNQAAGTSPALASNQSSPAWMYAVALDALGLTRTVQDQGTPDDGSYAYNYFDALVASGSQPVSSYGYAGMQSPLLSDCDASGPSNKTLYASVDPILAALIGGTAPSPSAQFQIGDWGIIEPEPDSSANRATRFSNSTARNTFLTHVRQMLAGGTPVAILVQEYSDFDNWYNTAPSKVMNPPASHLNGGYHFMLAIGYDDAMPYTNASGTQSTGAVRIQNSWGACFGDSGGYFWMSYEAFLNSISEAYVAYAVNDVPTSPSGVELQTTKAADLRARITRVRQTLHTHADGTERVHLVLDYFFNPAMRIRKLTLQGPTGPAVSQSLHRPRRSGYIYVSRQDGMQFEAGDYSVALILEDAQGTTQELKGVVHLGRLNNSTLPAGPLGPGMTGSNGAPVTVQ